MGLCLYIMKGRLRDPIPFWTRGAYGFGRGLSVAYLGDWPTVGNVNNVELLSTPCSQRITIISKVFILTFSVQFLNGLPKFKHPRFHNLNTGLVWYNNHNSFIFIFGSMQSWIVVLKILIKSISKQVFITVHRFS